MVNERLGKQGKDRRHCQQLRERSQELSLVFRFRWRSREAIYQGTNRLEVIISLENGVGKQLQLTVNTKHT